MGMAAAIAVLLANCATLAPAAPVGGAEELCDNMYTVVDGCITARDALKIDALKIRRRCSGPVCTMGSKHESWSYDTRGVNRDSIIYSVGISEDISWDIGMTLRHGCTVHGFDPTPTTSAYVAKAKIPAFHFTPSGLSDHKGLVVLPRQSGERMLVPVNTLANWMRALGHSQLTILKIDIEGYEYAVIEHFRNTNYWPFEQLLVEWHFQYLDSSRGHASSAAHLRALATLKAAGYVEFASSRGGQAISYKHGNRTRPTSRGVAHVRTQN